MENLLRRSKNVTNSNKNAKTWRLIKQTSTTWRKRSLSSQRK